jgi:preprotein translocase subunit SecG
VTVLTYVLYGLFILSCFILILVVLLQPGKGDAASALGGGVTGAAFGPRGATTLLAKITIGAAVAFMAIGFTLSVPGFITDRSVTSGMKTPAEAPATPTDIPAPAGAPGGAIPAGQMTIDEKGNITGGPVQGSTEGAAPTPAEQKPAESKPDEKAPEAKKPEAKKPETAPKK